MYSAVVHDKTLYTNIPLTCNLYNVDALWIINKWWLLPYESLTKHYILSYSIAQK